MIIDKKSISTGKAGEGCVYLRGATYYLSYMVNGRRKRVSLKTDDPKQAKNNAAEILRPSLAKTKEEAAVHIAVARKYHTEAVLLIHDAWDEYENSPNRPQSGANTLSNYCRQFEQFTEWLAVQYPTVDHLAQVDEEIAEAYANYLESALAPATFNAHRDTLHRITRVLSRKAGMTHNPWNDIAKKPLDTIVRDELTAAEVQILFNKLADESYTLTNRHEWEVIFHAGAFAGLRLADAVLMTWDCVNLKRNELSLIPIKTQRKKKRVSLPLHPDFRAALETAATWRDKDTDYICPNLATRYEYNPQGVRHDAVRVFEDCNAKDAPPVFVINRKVKGRCRAANVIGFHSLRHSFVSFCANAGVPLAVVQALVGHGSPAMTRHYTHISPEAAQGAMRALPVIGNGKRVHAHLTDTDKLAAIREIMAGAKRLTKREKTILNVLQAE
jgi:integrase